MGRRPRGELKAFIVRDLTDGEREKYGHDVIAVNNYTKMYWAGPYSGSGDTFYPYQSCARAHDFSTNADEEILKLVLKFPDLMGKLRIEFEFIPESDFEKKKRLKEARERRARWKAAVALSSASPTSSVTPSKESGPTTTDTGPGVPGK